MMDQMVVQDSGTHNHLENYSYVTLAAYNSSESLYTLNYSLEEPDAMFTLNLHFCNLY